MQDEVMSLPPLIVLAARGSADCEWMYTSLPATIGGSSGGGGGGGCGDVLCSE